MSNITASYLSSISGKIISTSVTKPGGGWGYLSIFCDTQMADGNRGQRYSAYGYMETKLIEVSLKPFTLNKKVQE